MPVLSRLKTPSLWRLYETRRCFPGRRSRHVRRIRRFRPGPVSEGEGAGEGGEVERCAGDAGGPGGGGGEAREREVPRAARGAVGVLPRRLRGQRGGGGEGAGGLRDLPEGAAERVDGREGVLEEGGLRLRGGAEGDRVAG